MTGLESLLHKYFPVLFRSDPGLSQSYTAINSNINSNINMNSININNSNNSCIGGGSSVDQESEVMKLLKAKRPKPVCASAPNSPGQ